MADLNSLVLCLLCGTMILINYLLIKNENLKYRINNLENDINDLNSELDLKEQENRELRKGA